MKDGRWVTIAESQFAHEKQGLDIVKQLLPDAPPFRAWSNFEFRDNRGRFTQVLRPDEARDYLRDIRMPYVTSISVRNETLGADADGLAYGTGGRFRGTVPVAFGHNRLHIEARADARHPRGVRHQKGTSGIMPSSRARSLAASSRRWSQ